MFRFFSNSSTPVNKSDEVPQLVRAEGVTKSLTEKLRLLEEERIKEKERAAKAAQLKSKMIAAKSAIRSLDLEVKEAEKRLSQEREVSQNLESEVMAVAMDLDTFLDQFEEPQFQIAEPVDDGVTLQSFQEYANIPE